MYLIMILTNDKLITVFTNDVLYSVKNWPQNVYKVVYVVLKVESWVVYKLHYYGVHNRLFEIFTKLYILFST